MLKILTRVVLGLIGISVVLAIVYADNLKRLHMAITLYDEDKIATNFVSMPEAFNTTRLNPSSSPVPFTKHIRPFEDLSIETAYGAESIATFIQDSRTTGLMVIHDGIIVYEYYGETGGELKPHISFSVAKSFISALMGIAISQGHITDIAQPVTDYVPELVGTGYDGVAIKDVLQMSSGVGFNEDYADFYSDINRFSRAIAFGTSLDDFTASLQREREPGIFNQYVSIDTQVLGMVLVRATQQSLTQYAQKHLWEPLGMEDAAYWLSDDVGMELALGGLNVTLRDYAKFGWLYANQGKLNGQQIVPAAWVTSSITPDEPHLMPGENSQSNSSYGYGYQWWLPPVESDEFMARGIYHQYIYIDPDARVVIVKTSANHRYNDQSLAWSERHLMLFQTLSTFYSSNK